LCSGGGGAVFAVEALDEGENLQSVPLLLVCLVFRILLFEEDGGGLWRQSGWFSRFLEFGFRIGVAVGPFVNVDGVFVGIFDADGIVGAAEGAAGVVTLLLKDADFLVKAAEDVDHFGVFVEIGFEILTGLLNEDLRKACGGGLEADFGEF
jgi:hypothetical protein